MKTLNKWTNMQNLHSHGILQNIFLKAITIFSSIPLIFIPSDQNISTDESHLGSADGLAPGSVINVFT